MSEQIDTDKVLKFLHAADTDDISMVQKLLNEGIDPNAMIDDEVVNMAAIHFAAGRGNYEIVQLLLICGANPNMPTVGPRGGVLPLHFAVRAKCIQSIRLIMQYGGKDSLYAKAPNGMTAISMSKSNDCHKVLNELKRYMK